MSFVYAIAFSGRRFLMVYNPRRHGWEMPGGRMEADETPEQAVVREFREETGQGFRPRTKVPFRDGHVFAGDLMLVDGQGEMDWRLFDIIAGRAGLSRGGICRATAVGRGMPLP